MHRQVLIGAVRAVAAPGRGGALLVVVGLVLGQDSAWLALSEDQHPAGQFGAPCADESFRVAVGLRGQRGGIFMTWMPAAANTMSKA